MKLIFLGPPGAGKGTQAAGVSAHLRVPHISTGDMFRSAIRNETPVGLEAKKYLEEGQFAEGSMAPKVRAAIMFVEHGGKECIITEAGQLNNPNCGTRIVK